MVILSVWHNGAEWVIAQDEEDAREIMREQYPGLSTEELDYEGWRRLDDDEEFTMIDVGHDWVSGKTRKLIPRTAHVRATALASEWAKHRGRGWLASTEW